MGGAWFRILEGGGQGGPNSQQAHDVVMTSMLRNDVASTSFRRHVPNRFLTNQYQIITFLILKYDIIENSRIELRGIVLSVQVGGLLGGGGAKGMPPPLFLRLCQFFPLGVHPSSEELCRARKHMGGHKNRPILHQNGMENRNGALKKTIKTEFLRCSCSR